MRAESAAEVTPAKIPRRSIKITGFCHADLAYYGSVFIVAALGPDVDPCDSARWLDPGTRRKVADILKRVPSN